MNDHKFLHEIVEPVKDRVVSNKDPNLPYIGLEHIAQGSPLLLGYLPSHKSTSTNTVFKSGDILFGKLRPNLKKSVQVNFDGYCSTDIIVLRALEGTSSQFAARVLQQEDVFRYAEQTAIGTKMPRTAWVDLQNLHVFVPTDEQEQSLIAAILDTIDDSIRYTEQLIDKLKQVRIGLLHDLLTYGIDENGDLRDPVRHLEQFKKSELGLIPREWELERLGSLAEGGISNGLFKKPELTGQGCRLVNVFDLYQSFGINIEQLDRLQATEAEMKKYEVLPGDCFFTRSSLVLSGIAHCNIVRELQEPAIFEAHLMRVRPKKRKIVPEFLALWCRSDFARRFFMNRAKQVTMTTIAQPDIAPLPVPVFNTAEQNLIVEKHDALANYVNDEEIYLEKLTLLKQGLMDDLLKGRVRVTILLGK